MYRLFIPKDQIPNIIGSDVHYLKDVLRLKVGDRLELLDGSGKIYLAEITEITKNKIVCKIISENNELGKVNFAATIAQAIPKGSKMDFIVQKCVELGVEKIIPMETERNQIKDTGKIKRWRKIAKESAKQCGRVTLPEITEVLKFDEVLQLRNNYDLALIPWELEKKQTLKSVLSSEFGPAVMRSGGLVVLIGPEGGFSQIEIEAAKKSGFISVSLGERILRTETAAMAMLAMLNFYYTS